MHKPHIFAEGCKRVIFPMILSKSYLPPRCYLHILFAPSDLVWALVVCRACSPLCTLPKPKARGCKPGCNTVAFNISCTRWLLVWGCDVPVNSKLGLVSRDKALVLSAAVVPLSFSSLLQCASNRWKALSSSPEEPTKGDDFLWTSECSKSLQQNMWPSLKTGKTLKSCPQWLKIKDILLLPRWPGLCKWERLKDSFLLRKMYCSWILPLCIAQETWCSFCVMNDEKDEVFEDLYKSFLDFESKTQRWVLWA